MAPRRYIQAGCWLLGAAIVTGCTGGQAAHHPGGRHAAGHVAVPTAGPLTRADIRRCPKTVPGDYRHESMLVLRRSARSLRFPTTPATAVIVHRFTAGTFAYGNGKLWTLLNLPGLIVAPKDMVHPDGSIWWKFPWWRTVAGYLTITGRRLDGPAPPLRSTVPAGYGDTGFQASGVTFPTEGCWQVTARTARASLTFVTFVITKAHRSLLFSGG